MPLELVRIPYHPLVRAVATALRQHCRVAGRKGLSGGSGGGGAGILVAVSGGADSVALLRALAAIAPRRGWRMALSVGHVQHHLRPPREAEADAAFVAELARSLGLPFLRADLEPPKGRRRTNTEDWARRERYRALCAMAHSIAATYVATAHHADDQLETLLMRVLRGSSVRGLSGMRWRRRLPAPGDEGTGTSGGPHLTTALAGRGERSNLWLIRPMLGVDAHGARQFLRDIAQEWREDSTNQDASRVRAALRLKVLPELRKLCPSAPAKAVRLGDHLRQVQRLLDNAVSGAAERVSREPARADTGSGRDLPGGATVERTDLRMMSPVVRSGLLRRLLVEAGVARDRLGQRQLGPILCAIKDTAGGRRTFDLGSGVKASVERDVVRISARETRKAHA